VRDKVFPGSQLLPDGLKFFVVSLQLSVAAIEQLQVVLIVLLQMQKLYAQHTENGVIRFWQVVLCQTRATPKGVTDLVVRSNKLFFSVMQLQCSISFARSQLNRICHSQGSIVA
jgi:hypothetical protein